jgi:putative ABC transport system substrate-binding protein
MKRTTILLALLFSLSFLAMRAVEAQQATVHRVGVILHGGTYLSAIAGVRDGLRDLGFEEGKQFVFHVRDVRGDLTAVEAAARSLEDDKIDVIYTVATSVTLAAKQATRRIPIVFYAGTDPVAVGLVEGYRRPGGRLTGVHGRFTDLAAKRPQLLKEMVPTLRRAVTFYNPQNPAARQSIGFGRDAARQLNVELEILVVNAPLFLVDSRLRCATS